jgi:DNA-binding PadR family transcriptional regulator
MREVRYPLRKTTLEIFLLAMLRESDMYAQQMVQQLNEKSEWRYRVTSGMVGDNINSLRCKGFVSCRKGETKGNRNRNLYHLEPSGLTYLREQWDGFFFVGEFLRDMTGGDWA